jgi:hypothetical protein
MLDVVRADAFQPRFLHCLPDDRAIGLVQIEGTAGGKVRLLAEPHNDEAFLFFRHGERSM